MNIDISFADYSNAQHNKDITYLLNCYATDPMGGGIPLTPYVIDNLITELAKRPHAISVICYVDGTPAGLINCFEGFSTFKCKPLINIHDVVVLEEFRGLGLCQRMLSKVEELAINNDCCKITLEVLEGNEAAKNAYLKYGFEGYELNPAHGNALFWHKPL
jgi:ribosomal protein S18 acetylase RimI-like enzyme